MATIDGNRLGADSVNEAAVALGAATAAPLVCGVDDPRAEGGDDLDSHAHRRSDDGPRSLTRANVVAVVDDDPYMLRALGRTLNANGYRTLLFDNPWTALNGIPAAAADLVITDRHMPLCSGPDLARRLRASWGDDAPPIVLLSGDLAGLEDGERSLFELVLAKPIRPDDLMLAIGAFSRRRRVSGAMRKVASFVDGEDE